ncbi:metallophosphoesterase [Vallitaleaceae bacterium 9-2]
MININNRRLTIGVVLLIILSVWLHWGNTSIQLTYITARSKELPKSFEGFSIAHVSDLHNTRFGANQEALLKAIKKEAPDIIVITGDLIDSYSTDVEIAMEFVNGAVSIAPVYYVTGNHEARVSTAFDKLKQDMLQAGVVMLDNEGITLEHQEEQIRLLGVNDPFFEKDNQEESDAHYMKRTLASLIKPDDPYTILLSHRPEMFEIYVDQGIDLTFSGHAHGGQIRLPLVGPILAPHQGVFPKYANGLYSKDSGQMIVSRGLGNSLFPLRINNRPQLVIATLEKKR